MKEPDIDFVLLDQLKELLQKIPLPRGYGFLRELIYLGASVILAWLFFLLVRLVVVKIFTIVARRTSNRWDDKLLARRVLQKLCHLVPALILLGVGGGLLHGTLRTVLVVLSKVYVVLSLVLAVNALLLSSNDIYQLYPLSKERPIRPFIQLLQIVVGCLGGIVAVSLLLGKDPSSVFLGLGAMAAVMMLIFQDTILGLVASVQVFTTHMVKPGDWIEMPSRNTDGEVIEILLNTVKVRNWDLSISTFPTYALIQESFKNYKGLNQSGGRQISRSLLLDVETVHFLDSSTVNRLVQRFPQLKTYGEELSLAAPKRPGGAYIGTQVTNLSLFRHYTLAYLQSRPEVLSNMPCVVRLQAPTSKGLPLNLYTFLKYTDMIPYEGVQSDIFEHLYAVLPSFGLRVFQDVQSPPRENYPPIVLP